MAIGYLNVSIVGRADGRSAVEAAAYASRSRLLDERTGIFYDYSRNAADVIFSGVFLPKDAPEHLRDRATLWNAVEKAETRKNSQLARRIILAMPHELTDEQNRQLLTDYIRENFTRKGLAVDASMHRPDRHGDERNDHSHLYIPTRYVDKTGIGKKDRDSNERAATEQLKLNWLKLGNRYLERHGHVARISFETPEGHEPQIHLGQRASALERKGIRTRAGDRLREIVNDNDRRRQLANGNRARHPGAVGKEFAREVIRPPATIDRDEQAAEWQGQVDAAGIAWAEEQRRQLLMQQQTARAALEQEGRAMLERHSAAWTEALQRHAAETGTTIEQASEAVTGSASFLTSLFASLAESVTSSLTGSTRKGKGKGQGKTKPNAKEREEQQRRDREQKERQQRQAELEAILEQQARERQQWERRKAFMLDGQAQARAHFEQEISQRSPLQSAFEKETPFIKRDEPAAKKETRPDRDKGRGRDGPELG